MPQSFSDLGVSEVVVKALLADGIESPFAIQRLVIGDVLAGHDTLVKSPTGSGKTLAFGVPLVDRVEANVSIAKRPCALVLAPTRELASQIVDDLRPLAHARALGITAVYGGVGLEKQARAAAKSHIIVATPGRLLDHMQQKTLDLSQTEIFVLDEADQMLDLGFVKPIRQIVSRIPAKRQNLFFSATMPTEIGKLAGELLKDPVKVSVTPQATTVQRISQSIIHIEQGRKRALLTEMFADPGYTRCLVFTKTKHGADKVAAYLEAGGVEAGAIHGNKSQPQRERTLAAFKAGKLRVLVATDIAARGIDVDGVSHVLNFELPYVPEAYVHRIGRTARAGADGTAISFVAGDEMKLLRDIEKVTRQKIPSTDRRNDKSLALLDQSIMASGVKSKATMPDREERDNRGGPRNRNPRRDGVKLEGGGQPHRVRKPGPGRDARPTPERSFDPMARERPRPTNNDPRHTSAPAAASAKPDGEIKRRPRSRRPSNGGKGYVAKG